MRSRVVHYFVITLAILGTLGGFCGLVAYARLLDAHHAFGWFVVSLVCALSAYGLGRLGPPPAQKG